MVSIIQCQRLFLVLLISVLIGCGSSEPKPEVPVTDIYDALVNDEINYKSEDEDVSAVTPEYLDSQLRQIRSKFFRQQYDDAADLSERLLRIDGNISEAYYWLARIRIEQADYQQAYEMATKGLTISPSRNMKRELERVQRSAQVGAN